MARRQAPAFQIESAPQPRLQGLVSWVAALAMVALVAAITSHFDGLFVLFAAVPAAAWLGWEQARILPRRLQWDGQVWRLALAGAHDPGEEVRVEVKADFGDWLLLRTHPSSRLFAGRCYIPVTRALVGAQWGALRATLYSARVGGVTSAKPPR